MIEQDSRGTRQTRWWMFRVQKREPCTYSSGILPPESPGQRPEDPNPPDPRSESGRISTSCTVNAATGTTTN